MRTNDRLTFKLLAQDNGSNTVDEYMVHPGYNGLKLVYNKPDGQMYHTTEVEGEFVFLGQEAQLIHSRSIYCNFTLVIYDEGNEIVRGTFRKTDCQTDLNHWRIQTKIKANDMYDELESNNSEYNITKMGLETTDLGIHIYPSVQIYPLGGNEVHLYHKGNTHYDAEANFVVDDASTLYTQYLFGNDQFYFGAVIDADGVISMSGITPIPTDAYGVYARQTSLANVLDIHIDNINGNGWYLWYTRASISDEEFNLSLVGPNGEFYNMCTLSQDAQIQSPIPMTGLNNTVSLFVRDSYQAAMLAHRVECRFWFPCGRIVGGSVLQSELPSDDIVTTNNKYGLPIGVDAVISTNISSVDKGYGSYVDANGDTYYYDKPSSGTYYPLWKESWIKGVSIWLNDSYLTQQIITANTTNQIIADWYLLGDVIKGMLAKIDSSVVFESDSYHSRFFFDRTNPVSGAMQYPIYITQKSNLLNYTYQYPAWKAMLTWNRLETMLRNLFNCYYDIYTDANGVRHLRIEHWTFYANGLSYSSDPRTNVDLNHIHDGRNGQPMAFHTNRWEYDTDRPASRLEFGWMDTQSEPFDAYPIEVPSDYMIYSRNTVDDRAVDWFSADIDFMLAISSEVSSDGFVIVMSDGGESSAAGGFVHQGTVQIGSTDYYCQNDRMALGYLQKRFLTAGIYAPYVTLDNTDDLVAVSTYERKKMRLQEVEFTLPKGVMPIPAYNYVTEVGTGNVESMEVDLTNMRVTATLRHPTETN